MKKSILLLLLVCSQVYTQNQFQYAIGKQYNEYISSILQTYDGSYVATGGTFAYGYQLDWNMYVVKSNASGVIQWSKIIGNDNFDDRGYTILQTIGGYLVVGWTRAYSSNGRFNIFLVKLDAAGTLQWSKVLGGEFHDGVLGSKSTIQTADGGFAIAGYTNSFNLGSYDLYILKTDSVGTVQWSKTIGGTGNDNAQAIIQTSDGGFVVSGNTNSYGAGGDDFYIVKLNDSGTVQWTRTVGGTNNEYCSSIIQTTGGYILAGNTKSFGAGGEDIYIVKIDSNGNLLWTRTVGGTEYDHANTIIPVSNGGYIVAGRTLSFGAGGADIYLIEIDNGGALQWSKTIGGANNDYAVDIIQTLDGGYMVGGDTRSYGAGTEDFFYVKLDTSASACGNTTSPTGFTGTGGTSTSPAPTVTSPTTPDSTVIPLIRTGGTLTTICTVTGSEPGSIKILNKFSLEQNYPNPFNPVTKISLELPKSGDVKLTIFDVTGREVAVLLNEQLSSGTYDIEWDGSNYPSGVYFYRLEAGDYVETRKMILIK